MDALKHTDSKSYSRKEIKRVFKKEKSVFKDWKEDVKHTIEKSVEIETRKWKIPRFIKDTQDVSDLC